MQIKSEKYSYVVPGLEKFKLTTMDEVYNTIEEFALVNEKYLEEEDIDKLYYTHKVSAKANEYFNSMHDKLNKLESKKPSCSTIQQKEKEFLNFVIRRKYYAYIYKDYKKYGLTLSYISWLSSLHYEYTKVCKKIVSLYDSKNFSSISPAEDPGWGES